MKVQGAKILLPSTADTSCTAVSYTIENATNPRRLALLLALNSNQKKCRAPLIDRNMDTLRV